MVHQQIWGIFPRFALSWQTAQAGVHCGLPMSPEQLSESEPSRSEPSDAELIAALRSGAVEALGVLYARHSGLVYGVALKLLKDAHEAEDLTQAIFLSLIQKDRYDPKRGALRTFLAILTRSRAIDRLRKQTRSQKQLRRQISEQSEKLTSTETGLDTISEMEQSEDVRNALSQLSSTEQEVLKMAYYDGLSQSKIAQELELSLGTVKSRSRRGLMKLRQILSHVVERV